MGQPVPALQDVGPEKKHLCSSSSFSQLLMVLLQSGLNQRYSSTEMVTR